MSIFSIVKPHKWFFKLPRFRKKKNELQNPLMTQNIISKGSLKTNFQRVFSHFDSNDDGKISNEELRSYFASMGDFMSYDEAQRVIIEFDSNGDGQLEFTDFVKLVEGNNENDNNNDDSEDDGVRSAFGMFEVEKGCGYITAKGVQQVLNRLGDEKSEEECKAMIRVFDLDRNGVLDFNEFRMMMT